MNIDNMLIFYCSPTLAGLKMASLLCLPQQENMPEFRNLIDNYNQKYNKQHLHFRILHACSQRILLYIYRPDRVASYVHRQDIFSFLMQYGYSSGSVGTMLDYLSKRFSIHGCFPHEAGIFLGYPLEDVRGFITHKGNNAKLCGEWKVYGDPLAATRIFHAYHCCRQEYISRFRSGTTLKSLIVA
jgi:hypothetical protein